MRAFNYHVLDLAEVCRDGDVISVSRGVVWQIPPPRSASE
jgi:hypothetical protein